MNGRGGGVGSDMGDMGDSNGGRISERTIVFWPIILSGLSYDHNLNKDHGEGMDGIDRISRVKSFSAFTLIDKW